jgi:membrane-bound lytic murein transglycosylase D
MAALFRLVLMVALALLVSAPGASEAAGKRAKKKAKQGQEPAAEAGPATEEVAPPALPSGGPAEEKVRELSPEELETARQRRVEFARARAALEDVGVELEGSPDEVHDSAAAAAEMGVDPDLLRRVLESRDRGLGTSEWREFLDEVLGGPAGTARAPRSLVSRMNLGPVWIDPLLDIYKEPAAAVRRWARLRPDQVEPADFDYPVVVNERVLAWMDYFRGKGKKWFRIYAERTPRFRPIIDPALRAADMPSDLFYQAMIESGLTTGARSRVGAGGLWQFMPYTGRSFDLAQSHWVDQRRDPWLATDAAIRYMTYLYGLFGHWWIASAAYNAGEGKLGRAIERYSSENFWVLCRGDYLKPETKNYVPKLIAAAIMHRYLDRFGLDEGLEFHEPWQVEKVLIDGAVDLDLLAELAGIAEADLRIINPAIKQWTTPPDLEAYPLWVPEGTGAAVADGVAAIPPEQRVTYLSYKVKSGDVLSKIARRYGVSVDQITRMNKVRNPRALRVGQVLVLPLQGAGKSADKGAVERSGSDAKDGSKKANHRMERTASRNKASKSGQGSSHTVKSGDTLSAIALAHGLDVGDLKRWNEIKGDTIHPGQRLRLSAPPPKTVTVQMGDNLWSIARQLGVSLAELLRANGLQEGSVIHPGQILKVPRI